MDNVEMSENSEAGLVIISMAGSGIIGFLAAIPLPIEWKAPIVTLIGTITTIVTLYWKHFVNKKK